MIVSLSTPNERRCKTDLEELLQKIVGTNHGDTLNILKEEEFDVKSFHSPDGRGVWYGGIQYLPIFWTVFW